MNNLDEIYVFTHVAQLESFTKASKVLQMPVSTVSRKVSELENRVGVSLILRTTRRLSLTAQGLEFFEQCAEHIRGLEDAQTSLTQLLSEPSGILRITVPVVLRQGSFIDFVSDFMKKNPKIHIDLLITNQYLNLISEKVDIAIRFGNLKDSGLIAKRLGVSRQLLVASPKYLEKMGAPKTPKDLKNYPCVLFGGYKDSVEWSLFNGKSKNKVTVSGAISGSDYYSVNEFAIRGHGIALLPEVYCQDAFENGELINVLSQWSSSLIPVHALYLERKFIPLRLRLFLSELSKWENKNWS